jgi:hypothetical protein
MNDERNWTAQQRAEWELQERARRLERDGAGGRDEPAVDRYRAVMRAAQQARVAGPPPDFATQVAARLRDQELDERIERWLLRIAGVIALVCALYFAGAELRAIAQSTADALAAVAPGAQWLRNPMWLMVLTAAVSAGIFDVGLKGAGRR